MQSFPSVRPTESTRLNPLFSDQEVINMGETPPPQLLETATYWESFCTPTDNFVSPRTRLIIALNVTAYVGMGTAIMLYQYYGAGAEGTLSRAATIGFASSSPSLFFGGLLGYMFNTWRQNETKEQTAFREYIAKWEPANAELIKNYFCTKMWNTAPAKANPTDFEQRQLRLFENMDNNPELRGKCFALAVAGDADCHDNAISMFLQMEKLSAGIDLHRPDATAEQIINYYSALNNEANLTKIIEETFPLKEAVKGSEGTEAFMALQLLCHQNGILLPAPVTAMAHEDCGWSQFKKMGKSQEKIKANALKKITSGMPKNTPPTPEFLASQPCWQACLDRQNPEIKVAKDKLQVEADEKIDAENASLFQKSSNGEKSKVGNNREVIQAELDRDAARLSLIAENIQTIKEELERKITDLYLKSMRSLLEQLQPAKQ